MSFSHMTIGHIDQLDGSRVLGWMYAAVPHTRPLLLVDNRPAMLEEWPMTREDVREACGLDASTGFCFRIPFLSPDARLRLYAVNANGATLLDEKCLPHHVCETNIFIQLREAARIARKPGAVGVVCWDGAHNPCGRAKVLRDVLAQKRPVVVFVYLFDTFGTEIWGPVARSGIVVVTIPWAERELYHLLLSKAGICLPTLWLCKPRLPSFQLARLVGMPNARCVLDIDDNEEAFIQGENAKDTVHGFAGQNLARACLRTLPGRTVASCSLQETHGGHMVRHARALPPPAPRRVREGVARIGFIGTVRAHKLLPAAARAVTLAGHVAQMPGVLHVYGDIDSEMQGELRDAGAVLGGAVAPDELPGLIRSMDVVLTGFPVADAEDNPIARYQISSKISDALSAGVPVLTPMTPAVADLADVPGVFLFTTATFLEQYIRALHCTQPITLPHEFTLEGAYESFVRAEQEAGSLDALPLSSLATQGAQAPQGRTLVLLWKQHDAGLYGRRVDQIARSYKRRYPEDQVIILEFLDAPRKALYRACAHNFSSDSSMILALSESKLREGYVCADSVLHIMQDATTPQELRRQFLHFLARYSILPQTSCFVLFPVISDLECVQDMLSPYPKIVDVVDNQTVWASSDNALLHMHAQYTSLLRGAEVAVFNAQSNCELFAKKGLLPQETPRCHIPNWYTLPMSAAATVHAQPPADDAMHIVYSGNMNDRVDWTLLHAVCGLPQTVLHLVGAGFRRQDMLFTLLKNPAAVYHGPLNEARTLELVRRADAAIVPHMNDHCSAFMNPMKLHMYAILGIPVLCASIAGVQPQAHTIVCTDHAHMLAELAALRQSLPALRARVRTPLSSSSESETLYLNLIEQCFTVKP